MKSSNKIKGWSYIGKDWWHLKKCGDFELKSADNMYFEIGAYVNRAHNWNDDKPIPGKYSYMLYLINDKVEGGRYSTPQEAARKAEQIIAVRLKKLEKEFSTKIRKELKALRT